MHAMQWRINTAWLPPPKGHHGGWVQHKDFPYHWVSVHKNERRSRLQALGLAHNKCLCWKKFGVITLGLVFHEFGRWRGKCLAYFLGPGSAEEKWEKRAFSVQIFLKRKKRGDWGRVLACMVSPSPLLVSWDLQWL